MRDKPKTAIIMIEERCSLKFGLGKVLLQAAVPTTSKCCDRFPPPPVKKIGPQCVHVWLTKLSCFDGGGYKLKGSVLSLSFY